MRVFPTHPGLCNTSMIAPHGSDVTFLPLIHETLWYLHCFSGRGSTEEEGATRWQIKKIAREPRCLQLILWTCETLVDANKHSFAFPINSVKICDSLNKKYNTYISFLNSWSTCWPLFFFLFRGRSKASALQRVRSRRRGRRSPPVPSHSPHFRRRRLH